MPTCLKKISMVLGNTSRLAWAEKFLDRWSTRVMRSRIEPMKKVAKIIRNHKPLIMNCFKVKKSFSCGVVEGLNNKAKVTTRTSYDFRTYRGAEVALYHALGNQPTYAANDPQILLRRHFL